MPSTKKSASFPWEDDVAKSLAMESIRRRSLFLFCWRFGIDMPSDAAKAAERTCHAGTILRLYESLARPLSNLKRTFF